MSSECEWARVTGQGTDLALTCAQVDVAESDQGALAESKHRSVGVKDVECQGLINLGLLSKKDLFNQVLIAYLINGYYSNTVSQ